MRRGERGARGRDGGRPGWVRWLLIAAGAISLGLGVLGVFVPLLPTTPFLLLAAGCFFRSSERLYHWLIHHRWFGDYVRHYREHRAITRGAKVFTLVLLWGVIGFSAFAIARAWWVRGLLGAIALGVTAHILTLKTLTPDMLARSQAEPR